MRFFELLGRLLGQKVKPIPAPSGGLAELSRALTREPVTLEPAGPRRTGLTTNDIDPDTGHPYPDYLERRRARAATSTEPRLCYVVDRDVSPEE